MHGAVGLAKAVAGVRRAPEGEILQRRRVCRGCEKAMPCAGLVGRACRCAVCGCVIRAKTANRDETCPLGKW